MPFQKRLRKKLRTLLRCVILLAWPTIAAAVISLVWYFVAYRGGFHLSAQLEEVISAAWIPVFGILYSLLFAIALNTVWSEYKMMRTAVKRRDLETFVDLRDEELSPLVITAVVVASLAVLLGFAALQYPDAMSGSIIIFGVTFLLTLMLSIVIEIDDPCSGLWFIRSIPPGWLDIDPRQHRDLRSTPREKLPSNRKIRSLS